MLSRSLLSATIAAVIWVVISFATGASAAFSLGGAVLCGVVVFVIAYACRRLYAGRRGAG